MGTLTAVGLLPHLLFSLPAGVWLDRVRVAAPADDRGRLGRAALIASIPLAYALDALSMPQLYVVGFLTGTLAVVFDLSWNTLFVAVTKRDRYVEAMALLNGSRSLASVAGPTIGGLLVQVLGAPLAMLADALSYLGSVVFLRRIRSPEPPIEPEEGSIRERLLAGLVVRRSSTRSCARRCSSVATDQPVHLRLERAVHPVRDDDPRRLAGRARASRSGSARSVAVIGASSRRGSVGGSGSARPTRSAAHLPGVAAPRSRWPTRTCRWR